MINLISDTVTKPTSGMLEAMFKAEVGDDVFRQDPTVNALEQKVARMFGKESALFCPSGTMTNQIAIKIHTQPLDEMICDHYSHVYQYETGGYAFNSGIAVNLIEGKNGKFTAKQLEASIKQEYDWLPTSKLCVIENSCNKGGGSYYTLDEIIPIAEVCKNHRLKLHLDGARLFNVLVETNETPLEVGKCFDSISICLSKGLGAPVGSLLIGNQEDLKRARRFRKVMGGGMRQAGILAAAGIYALDHHIENLRKDNIRAKRIGELIHELDFAKSVRPVKTNIIIFDLEDHISADQFIEILKNKNINAHAFGPQSIRFVFHLDITEKMMEELVDTLKSIK